MSKIRLGRTPTGEDIYLDPFDNQHAVFTGRTRSGKSVALYSMLAQMRDIPVKVCGIDPTGVLFNALGEGLGGSDLRVMTLRDANRVGAVIDEIVRIMDDRIEQLLAQGLDKFEHATADFPLLMVVFEEYPGTLAALAAIDKATGAKAADRIENKVRAAVQRLALEGLKAMVKVVIASQRADASILTGVLRSQLTTRVSFAQDADGLRMLHEEISPEQIDQAALFLPGQGFVEIPGQTDLTLFRADLIAYDQLADHFRRSNVSGGG